MASLRSLAAAARCGRARRLQDLQAGNAALAARAKAAEDEAARVLGDLAKVENQLDRFRAEEFWDRVMQEIAELIAERGPLTPEEILYGLRTWTVRGAALHKEPLTPGRSGRRWTFG